MTCSLRQRRAAEQAARLDRLDVDRRALAARRRAPPGRTRRTPRPALRRRPALDAADRQVVGVLRHRHQLLARERDACGAGAVTCSRQRRADQPRRDPGRDRRAVDLEVVRAGAEHAAARRQQRQAPQRPADRLADLDDEDRQRRAADEPEQAAAADRRRAPAATGDQPRRAVQSRTSAPGRVCARSSRSGFRTPRSR